MSSPMSSPSRPMTIDVSRTPPIPFARLVRVELRKAYDTLASLCLLISIAVLVVLVEGFFLVVGLVADNPGLTFTNFTVPVGYVLQPALATMAIMLVTSEWSQRTAMVTFSLEARRPHVLYAKLVAALGLAVLLVLSVVVIALLCSGLIELFSPDALTWDFGLGDFLGFVAFELLAVTMGYALATLIINTPAAIAAFPVLLYVIPSGLGIIGAFWGDFHTFARWINLQTAQGPIADWSLDTGAEVGHLIVCLIVWVAVPLVVGQARVMRAEVK